MQYRQDTHQGIRSRLLSLVAMFALLFGAAAATAVMAPAASASESYDNSVIATDALSYVGQYAQPDGQCWTFARNMIYAASGGTQDITAAAGGDDYFAHLQNAGGTQITNLSDLSEGDVVQIGHYGSDPNLHTFIIVNFVSGTTFTVVDANHDLDGIVHEYQRTVTLGSDEEAFRFGTVQSGSSADVQAITNGDGSVWAKDTVGVGGWTQEAGAGSVGKVAVGGATQMMLEPDGSVWAKSSIGNGGWNEELSSGVSNIAVSSTGVQMILLTSGAVYAKNGIGNGGWNDELDGGVSAIAVGGDTQVIVLTNGAVYAKSSIGSGGWNEELGSGASSVAVSSTGVQMLLLPDGSVWAKSSIGNGGWNEELSSGVSAISVGGNTQAIILTDGSLWAKSSIGNGGWNQEIDTGVASSVSVGADGLQLVLVTDGEVWAKTSVGYGGWTGETGSGTASVTTGS